MSIKMLFNKFILRLQNIRNFSRKTVENYERWLNFFDSYLKESFIDRGVEDCERILLTHINGFFLSQTNKGKGTKTCNLYLASIRSYLKFCAIEWYKVIDYHLVLYAREVDQKIESVCWTDCEKLIDYVKRVKVKTDKQATIKVRNIWIVLFFLYTGLRVSELSNLKREDVKEKIQIIGKWWVRRIVYLWRELMDVLKYYLRLRKDNNERLFINHSNNYEWKLSSVSIERMIRESAEAAGCSERIFPHKLRHTFATELLKNDVNLPTIQKLMWHKNLTTTQKYLTIEDSELKRAMETLKF